jgi:hypothetical protein
MLSARTVSMGNARTALKNRGDDVYETPPVAIEALLLAERLSHRLCEPCWPSDAPALSAFGIRRLILPSQVRRVCIFADHDEGGKSLNAAREAWRRWRAEGREVRVILPERVGEDANDILKWRLGHG